MALCTANGPLDDGTCILDSQDQYSIAHAPTCSTVPAPCERTLTAQTRAHNLAFRIFASIVKNSPFDESNNRSQRKPSRLIGMYVVRKDFHFTERSFKLDREQFTEDTMDMFRVIQVAWLISYQSIILTLLIDLIRVN
ncbi:hypothetical protein V1477_005947 [Vespula maculifrons]|uniref:Uncharacterized protein n=1 Tax=Vespula maculifrons TaxID=7453 RepID=A0ABD2CL12_VESMC